MEDVIDSIDSLADFCPKQWPDVAWHRDHVEAAVHEALRRLAQRLHNSARSEGILPASVSIDCEGSALVLREPDVEPRRFRNFAEVVVHLSVCCDVEVKTEISKELMHCLASEALSILYCRFLWPFRGHGSAQKLWDAVGRDVQTLESLAILEQVSAFAGHPTHPMWKTRSPLTFKETCTFAPEFASPVVPILVAARTRLMTIFPSITEWRALWEKEFPLAVELMAENIASEVLHEYAPLFLHPLNEQSLKERFAAAFASEDLLLIPQQAYQCRPTLSFRTLSMSDSFHVKLPVPVQSTSWPRYVSPVEVHESAIVTELLKQMQLPTDLVVLEERFACHATFGDKFSYRDCSYCSMILRESPLAVMRSECRIFLLAALFAPGGDNEPALWQMLWDQHGLKEEKLTSWFRCYAAKVIGIQISFFLRYGFTIEAHQQNTMLEFDRSGQLARLLYKEIGGGIEIDAERLEAFPDLDFSAKLYPQQDMIVAVSQCIALLRHSMLESHLLPLGRLAAKSSALPLDGFISTIREEIKQAIADSVQAPGDTWSDERFRAYGAGLASKLLDEPECTHKALLRMRLAGSKDYVFTQTPNPCCR